MRFALLHVVGLFLVVVSLQFGLYEAVGLGTCASANECTTTQNCYLGSCVEVTVFEPWNDVPKCIQPSDCTAPGLWECQGAVCTQGWCNEILREVGSKCNDNSDCNNGLICKDNKCFEEPLEPCPEDDPCPAGKMCIEMPGDPESGYCRPVG